MKTEVVLEKFSEMLIACMERQKSGTWKKGWLGGSLGCSPMSLSTQKAYNGINAFFLMMVTIEHEWKYPIFATFKQIKDAGGSVNKGEHSTPVLYWDFYYKDGDGHNVPESKFVTMSSDEQDECHKTSFLKSYNVFNVEQTDLNGKGIKKLIKLQEMMHSDEPSSDTIGMYSNSMIDDMLEKQSWLCPIIYDRMSDSAYYNLSTDKIVVPRKEQFKQGDSEHDVFVSGQYFYGTMLHEMAHSTGSSKRLNRENGRFGDKKYAKEELVAEISSSLCGQVLGFDKKMVDDNAKYLDCWIKALKKEPKFIVSVMADVNKAVQMILPHITKSEIVLR